MVLIDGDGAVDGVDRPDLADILDVDLEWSACTTAPPAPPARPGRGDASDAPAVHLRACDLAVERREQRDVRRPDDGGHVIAHDPCERVESDLDLTDDRSGLILDDPTLATRVS